MTFSSFSMAHYLHRQMRSLAQSGNSFSTSRIQSQIRVTTSGITQGVLYFLFDIFYFFDSFTYLLLGTLICCTVTYLMSVCVMFFCGLLSENYELSQITFLLSVCSVSTSMTSSAWLNFFYYTQIVPAQKAIFIWIKKNIKSIIYTVWLAERIYSLVDFTAMVLDILIVNVFESSNNLTVHYDILLRESSERLTDFTLVMIFIVKAHFFFCLCVMVMSSGSTTLYLCRHMRHMIANGQPLFCPRFSSQVRVTITGILQGVLYGFCAVWSVYVFFSISFVSQYTNFTIINLYMLGTTFNLGAGQAVFRFMKNSGESTKLPIFTSVYHSCS
uniref:Taste receptor type 2 n=1 Tax=Mastacembelus armatus TaxID=205130 RepID=A0A7N8YCB9_9TELE